MDDWCIPAFSKYVSFKNLFIVFIIYNHYKLKDSGFTKIFFDIEIMDFICFKFKHIKNNSVINIRCSILNSARNRAIKKGIENL